MQKMACRRRNRGRRVEDGVPHSTSLMSIPNEDYQSILEDVAYMLRNMDGAKDYMRECLANAELSGFSFKG